LLTSPVAARPSTDIANSNATMSSYTHSHLPTGSQILTNFNVAIIGSGIGGLSAAVALATYNPSLRASNVTVYEQAATYSEIGAGVAIGIQAARVLQKFGVWQAADSISGHRSNVHRSNRRWDNDDLIVDAPAASSEGDIRQMWIHRAEFLEVLFNEIKTRGYAKLETNKRVVKVEVTDPIYHSSAHQLQNALPYSSLLIIFLLMNLTGPWLNRKCHLCGWHHDCSESSNRLRWNP
jgi:hypothetical protein